MRFPIILFCFYLYSKNWISNNFQFFYQKKLEIGNWKLEIGNWKLEIGNRSEAKKNQEQASTLSIQVTTYEHYIERVSISRRSISLF